MKNAYRIQKLYKAWRNAADISDRAEAHYTAEPENVAAERVFDREWVNEVKAEARLVQAIVEEIGIDKVVALEMIHTEQFENLIMRLA